jgi:hypothetical protein
MQIAVRSARSFPSKPSGGPRARRKRTGANIGGPTALDPTQLATEQGPSEKIPQPSKFSNGISRQDGAH